jgi:hypothetical protein
MTNEEAIEKPEGDDLNTICDHCGKAINHDEAWPDEDGGVMCPDCATEAGAC